MNKHKAMKGCKWRTVYSSFHFSTTIICEFKINGKGYYSSICIRDWEKPIKTHEKDYYRRICLEIKLMTDHIIRVKYEIEQRGILANMSNQVDDKIYNDLTKGH